MLKSVQLWCVWAGLPVLWQTEAYSHDSAASSDSEHDYSCFALFIASNALKAVLPDLH